MGDKVRKNYTSATQLYQMEEGVRVIYQPDFNVWQVHKSGYASWNQVRYEVVGHQNSTQAFDFARLYVKYFKYGLSEEELKQITDEFKYIFSPEDIVEFEKRRDS